LLLLGDIFLLARDESAEICYTNEYNNIIQVSHSLNFFVVKKLSSYHFARPFGQKLSHYSFLPKAAYRHSA
jgi:hypothetical protein